MTEPTERGELPIEVLRQEIRSQLAKLRDLGFSVSRLDSLVSASQIYRRDTLYYEKIRDRELSEEQKDDEYKSFIATYDGLSSDNLTETLRYQHDRQTKESKLARAQFPEEDSAEYKVVLQIMTSLEIYLKVLEKRNPDYSLFRENLQMLSTSPEQLLTESTVKVTHQIERDATDEEKLDEIIFELETLQRYLFKCILQGDGVSDEILRDLANHLDRLSILKASSQVKEALKYISAHNFR